MNPNHFRVSPGGRSVASHAASMTNVPDPHRGSASGTDPSHPVCRSSPAASASFSGAFVWIGRYPRL